MKNEFIIEAVEGGYKFHHENRLSQIFSATFNNSVRFRNLFLKFIGIKKTTGLKSITQINHLDSQIDIVIKDDNKNIAIIENKIDSPLTVHQLEKYNKLKEYEDSYKIALVKHYFEFEETNWEIRHWGELYIYIKNEIKLDYDIKKTEDFLIEQFLKYLEALNMNIPEKISKDELDSFVNAFYILRYEDKPSISLRNNTLFETMNTYLKMLEQIIFSTREDSFFTEKIGKKYKFNPWIGHWWEDDSNKKKNLWIGVEIDLNTEVNEIKNISTGIYIYDNKDYEIKIIATDKNKHFLKEEIYDDENIDYLKYRQEVIRCWKKWLK